MLQDSAGHCQTRGTGNPHHPLGCSRPSGSQEGRGGRGLAPVSGIRAGSIPAWGPEGGSGWRQPPVAVHAPTACPSQPPCRGSRAWGRARGSCAPRADFRDFGALGHRGLHKAGCFRWGSAPHNPSVPPMAPGVGSPPVLKSCSFQLLFLLPGQHGVSQPRGGTLHGGCKTAVPHSPTSHGVPSTLFPRDSRVQGGPGD